MQKFFNRLIDKKSETVLMFEHEGVGMTEREKLFDLVDKVQDLYFDLCREEKEIKKLREFAENTFKDFKQFMRETRGQKC